jgi:hypothetical protein
MSDSRIASVARGQHGLITKQQALSSLAPSTLERWIRARRLEPMYRGVYRVAGAPDSWHQRLLGACLAAGPSAVASFRSAAALFELEGFAPDGLELTMFGCRPSLIHGVEMHESAVYNVRHLSRVAGIPVTSVARTLCDLTAVVRPWMVERAVDEALRRKLVTLRQLAQTADTLAGRGRHRCTVMRDILEHRRTGFDPGESDPEKRIAELLVACGLPEPTHQHPVRVGSRTFRIDLSYPEHMVAIEYDSWQHHSGRRAFDNDRARSNDLVVLGFSVLHFTSKSSDDAIVDTVRAALRRTSAS